MAWTSIGATRTDADSPVDEDLIGDIVDNTVYNHDRAVRGGTHGTGVRLALARGAVADSLSTNGSGEGTGTTVITFSTDSTDGNPNFSAAPTVVVGLEDPSGGTTWNTGGPIQASVWIDNGSLSSTGFTAVTEFLSADASITINYKVHFIAVGLVTTGE